MSVSPLIILALLLGCMAATVPVFMALFFAGLAGLVWGAGIDPQIVIEVLYRSMDKFALVVVLFFVLCGNIMTTGSIVKKLINTANVVVGWLPGGLAMAGVLACGFFGAISGSTVATMVAIGGVMIPALVEKGYDQKFAVGAMTSAPILGIIIPPSISMILYAMVTNDSIEALFLTGYIPGILIIVCMSLYCWYACRKAGMVPLPRPTLAETLAVLRESIWALLLPVLISVAEMMSMNIPTISNRPLTASRNSHGLVMLSTTALATLSGTCAKVRYSPNTEAPATITSSVAEVTAEDTMTFFTWVNFMSLWMQISTKNA